MFDQKLDDKSIMEDDDPSVSMGIDIIYTQKIHPKDSNFVSQ